MPACFASTGPDAFAAWEVWGPAFFSSPQPATRPTARIANLFVCRNEPAAVMIEHEHETGFEEFELLLKVWQLRKKYFPTNQGDLKP